MVIPYHNSGYVYKYIREPIRAFGNADQPMFSKNSILFFFLLKNKFLNFDHFDVLISKIIFKIYKKTSFWCISKQKTLWTATTIPNKLIYIEFMKSSPNSKKQIYEMSLDEVHLTYGISILLTLTLVNITFKTFYSKIW